MASCKLCFIELRIAYQSITDLIYYVFNTNDYML